MKEIRPEYVLGNFGETIQLFNDKVNEASKSHRPPITNGECTVLISEGIYALGLVLVELNRNVEVLVTKN